MTKNTSVCFTMAWLILSGASVNAANQSGIASVYSYKSGRTASGEHVQPSGLTAAHRSLPFGTKVRVTNRRNGRSVVVRINDRGPFVDGRAIDLSYAAAHLIGVIGPGTARVRIEVLGPVTLAAAVPVAAPVVNWSGFYIGGHAGVALSRDLFTFNIPDGGCGTACEDFRFTPSSFMGGGQVGFQSQVEKWVFGIEGTWSGLDLHRSRQSVLLPDPTLVSLKVDDIATVAARFGYAWDHAMFYAKAGYAAVRVGIHSFDTVTLVTGDDRAWRSGWTLGAGIEYMVVPSVVLGLEFDFYNLQFDNNQAVGFSDGTTFQISGSNADIFAVTARLSYLFNWGKGKAPAAVVAKY